MNCKICNNQTRVIYDEQMKYYYDVCDNCDFIYRQERFHVDIDSEKNRYLDHNNSMENVGYVNIFKNFIDIAILPFIQEGVSLDYGCGTVPILSQLLKKYNFTCYNYDMFFDNNVEYSNRKYDLITSTEVFEHFKNPIDDIEKIISISKTNTVVSIMTKFIAKDFLKWWYRRDLTHIAFYSINTFKIIAQKYNLEIIYTNNIDIVVMRKN